MIKLVFQLLSAKVSKLHFKKGKKNTKNAYVGSQPKAVACNSSLAPVLSKVMHMCWTSETKVNSLITRMAGC